MKHTNCVPIKWGLFLSAAPHVWPFFIFPHILYCGLFRPQTDERSFNMCCTNVSSLCKWFVVFISFIAGIALPFILNTLGITVTIVLPAVLLGLSVLLLGVTIFLSIRSFSRGGDLASCFCTIGQFLIATAVISVILAFVGLFIISAPFILTYTGILFAFFIAALLSLVCFLFCLTRTLCGCNLQ